LSSASAYIEIVVRTKKSYAVVTVVVIGSVGMIDDAKWGGINIAVWSERCVGGACEGRRIEPQQSELVDFSFWLVFDEVFH
jgi:hypothetical protein